MGGGGGGAQHPQLCAALPPPGERLLPPRGEENAAGSAGGPELPPGEGAPVQPGHPPVPSMEGGAGGGLGAEFWGPPRSGRLRCCRHQSTAGIGGWAVADPDGTRRRGPPHQDHPHLLAPPHPVGGSHLPPPYLEVLLLGGGPGGPLLLPLRGRSSGKWGRTKPPPPMPPPLPPPKLGVGGG